MSEVRIDVRISEDKWQEFDDFLKQHSRLSNSEYRRKGKAWKLKQAFRMGLEKSREHREKKENVAKNYQELERRMEELIDN